jgi:iron complex transport system substrate-binding protein
VGDCWPAEKASSGMEGGVEERSKKIGTLAPVVGPSHGDSSWRVGSRVGCHP